MPKYKLGCASKRLLHAIMWSWSIQNKVRHWLLIILKWLAVIGLTNEKLEWTLDYNHYNLLLEKLTHSYAIFRKIFNTRLKPWSNANFNWSWLAIQAVRYVRNRCENRRCASSHKDLKIAMLLVCVKAILQLGWIMIIKSNKTRDYVHVACPSF